MIYNMEQSCKIGDATFDYILSAKTRHSRNEPGGKLTITLPTKELKKHNVKPFDEVTWSAGYAETGLNTEFFGFVKEVTPGEKESTIEVRDAFWLCSRHRVRVNYLDIIRMWDELIEPLIPGGYGLSWDVRLATVQLYRFRNIYNKTGTFVLWVLKTSRNLDLRWDGKVLVIQPAFDARTLEGDLPEFKFGYNIVEDKLKLKAGKKLQIKVRGEDQSYMDRRGSGTFGRVIEGVYPARCPDCEELIVDVDSVSSTSDAVDQAKAIHTEKAGWGFTGSFIALGAPSARVADSIQITDPDNPERTIKTYVDTIEKNYDYQSATFRQEIWPGAFMEEPRA
ncbi:MAG: hypothetical protein KDK41_11980 [Leptospiraceae bacterium]|nr:hypothetical protein [Leptospiraceae bacterium]